MAPQRTLDRSSKRSRLPWHPDGESLLYIHSVLWNEHMRAQHNHEMDMISNLHHLLIYNHIWYLIGIKVKIVTHTPPSKNKLVAMLKYDLSQSETKRSKIQHIILWYWPSKNGFKVLLHKRPDLLVAIILPYTHTTINFLIYSTSSCIKLDLEISPSIVRRALLFNW